MCLTSATMHWNKLSSRFRHSILIRPVQPRNSTVQCIFLAYFAPQVLPFPMLRPLQPRIIADTTHKPFRIRFCANPAPKSFVIRFYENSRGYTPRSHSSSPLRAVQSLSSKSIPFTLLRPLAVSCLSFSPPRPLFSIACSLFCQKQGVGWGAEDQPMRGLHDNGWTGDLGRDT